MPDLFSDEMRRNPYPLYAKMRAASPVYHVPPPFDAWMIFDYQNVKRALHDHEAFSSSVPAPPHWFIFIDPPSHTRQRGLIAQAFTPKMIANLEPYIRDCSRTLLDRAAQSGEMDLAADFAVPLPMMVISKMIGIPASQWALFNRWSEVILRLSHTRSGGDEATAALMDFRAVTEEMGAYLSQLIERRKTAPEDDLLTRLIAAEIDGERLAPEEILGFFQLLVVAGQETTTNLIDNGVLCLLENPDQRRLLQERPDLLPAFIEETLRYRSPLQWMMRTPRRGIEVAGEFIPAGSLVLPMIGSANRDPQQFTDPDRFDLTRDPNPHVAFGHGIHFCLGAPLSRLEARIALGDVLDRLYNLEYSGDGPWEPRAAFHVLGPNRLPVRFQPARHASAMA